MERRFRLTRSTDFKRVRRLGKSYAHPLVVLVALRNEGGVTRCAVAAGRALGGAVVRNRAKRHLRESLRKLLPTISPGWDLVWIARAPLVRATFQEIQVAVLGLLKRAGFWKNPHAG